MSSRFWTKKKTEFFLVPERADWRWAGCCLPSGSDGSTEPHTPSYPTHRTRTHLPQHPQAASTPTSSPLSATAAVAPPSPAALDWLNSGGLTSTRDRFDGARRRWHTVADLIFDEHIKKGGGGCRDAGEGFPSSSKEWSMRGGNLSYGIYYGFFSLVSTKLTQLAAKRKKN
jgi:hypothetical protein